MFSIVDNCISMEACNYYKSKIQNWYFLQIKNGIPPLSWESRILDISEDKIVREIKKNIEHRFNLITNVQNVELQCWPINSDSELHSHDDRGRESTDYNSLLYLNDDFDGGDFFTDTGIIIKPKPGRLTFFNGATIKHGVKKVLNSNRYTIIFWWKRTKFK